MMYHAVAFWEPRGEELITCATRVSHLLSELQGINGPLSYWYELAYCKRSANELRRVEPSIGPVSKLLRVNRNDLHGQIIEELGYSLELWNGNDNDNEGATLSVHSGDSSVSMPYPNSVRLVSSDANFYKNVEPGFFIRLLVDVCKPVWAAYLSEQAWLGRNRRSQYPIIDNLVYLSSPVLSDAHRRAAKCTEECGDGLLLIM